MNEKAIIEFLKAHPNSDISQIAASFNRPNVTALSNIVHTAVREGRLAKQIVKTEDGKRLVQYRAP